MRAEAPVLPGLPPAPGTGSTRRRLALTEQSTQYHDISRFRVQSEHPCILDMLNIEDTVVANTLIDQRSVENIILIADNKEARRVMQHCPPRNCKQAYTKVGDEIYCHPTFRYYSANVDKARYLTANVEEEIAHYEGQIQSLQGELDKVRQRRNKLTEDIRRNKSEGKEMQHSTDEDRGGHAESAV
ncbi:structural maintenance of chromosomes protein 6-like [Haliotis rubra]|uniref:structural maintenance of chromosomes protein 6-like n=1 Tax=Haliotis rubra TaxID=36100 RepID=UPI001EE50BF6|nr:structural maintenance of chromosomes protein 6-like [Haliotis rubra]